MLAWGQCVRDDPGYFFSLCVDHHHHASESKLQKHPRQQTLLVPLRMLSASLILR